MPTALVTGASRGVGRGAAIALSDAGFTVYATGRSIAAASLPSSIVRLPCDHRDDAQTATAFAQIASAGAGLDVLVNSAWGGYERMVDANGRFTWTVPFWEQPLERWTLMLDSGVRAAYVCSAEAARVMVPAKRGLIVNVSFWAAQKFVGNTIYGIAKAATDKLTHDTAHELKPHGVTVVSLYPGLVRTESVLAAASQGWLDLSNSESPEFSGRIVAGLFKDPELHARSGQVLIGAAVARELGVIDVDGRAPAPLSLEGV
jgi:NAD(P)-dependent dehydrogenase (short-subunit alcohol dehydrogenase family)